MLLSRPSHAARASKPSYGIQSPRPPTSAHCCPPSPVYVVVLVREPFQRKCAFDVGDYGKALMIMRGSFSEAAHARAVRLNACDLCSCGFY